MDSQLSFFIFAGLLCFLSSFAVADNGFSQWSFFGICSQSCDGGTQSRKRTCVDSTKNCDGPVEEFRICNNHFCPIDGQYSDWSPFSLCTATCGGGTQSRTRKCNNPKPGIYGRPCQGPAQETQRCNTDICPSKPTLVLTEYFCEHVRGRSITCPPGLKMTILSAMYGRTSTLHCNYHSGQTTNCRAAGVLSKVSRSCNGKPGCYLVGANSQYGDPCRGVGKYLEVRYRCA